MDVARFYSAVDSEACSYGSVSDLGELDSYYSTSSYYSSDSSGGGSTATSTIYDNALREASGTTAAADLAPVILEDTMLWNEKVQHSWFLDFKPLIFHFGPFEPKSFSHAPM